MDWRKAVLVVVVRKTALSRGAGHLDEGKKKRVNTRTDPVRCKWVNRWANRERVKRMTDQKVKGIKNKSN